MALADDWGDPAAWEGMTAAGGVDLPGQVAAIVGLDEMLIHGWDLAKATGQPAGYDGPGLDEVLHLVTEFRGRGIEGLFGPEVPIPDLCAAARPHPGRPRQRPRVEADPTSSKLSRAVAETRLPPPGREVESRVESLLGTFDSFVREKIEKKLRR